MHHLPLLTSSVMMSMTFKVHQGNNKTVFANKKKKRMIKKKGVIIRNVKFK